MRRFAKRLSAISGIEEIMFFVNGEKHVVDKINPETKLIDYLRSCPEGLTGTKHLCKEGVCGFCTIVMQEEDDFDFITTKQINSCRFPLYQADGKHFLTIEGVENQKQILGKIQDLFVTHQAFQCGYCTSGLIMHLYGEVLKNPQITRKELEHSLTNTTCRCTGYRPIIQAVQTLHEDLNELGQDIFDQYESQVIFPKELRTYNQRNSPKVVNLVHEDTQKPQIFHPTTLEEVLEIFEDGGKVIGGALFATDLLSSFGSAAIVDTRGVRELTEITITETEATFGSALTLSELCEYLLRENPDNQVFEILGNILDEIASEQVRNVSTVGGNIFNETMYISDLLLFLHGVAGTLNILGPDGNIRNISLGASPNLSYPIDLSTGEILHSITIPVVNDECTVLSYHKQKRRRYIDRQICNSMMMIEIDTATKQVTNFQMVVGGLLEKKFMTFPEITSVMIGEEFGEGSFTRCLNIMAETLNDTQLDISGGMEKYRRVLILSFFQKFYYQFRKQFLCESQDDRIESTLSDFEKKEFEGKIEYEEIPVGTSQGRSELNIYSQQYVTGSAQYLDDLPNFRNELQGFIVYSTVPHGIIKKIDPSEALKMDGVVDWVDYNDIPGLNDFSITGISDDEEFFASEKINAYGQPIGILLAENYKQAKTAAREMIIDITPLDAILSLHDGITAGTYYEHYPQIQRGDPEKVFENCKNVVTGELQIGGQNHFYGEVHCSLVIPHINGDEFEIYASSQDLTGIQNNVGIALDIPYHKIVAKVKKMGGAFGGKHSRSVYFATLNAIAANKVGVPTRLVFERHDDSQMGTARHPFFSKYKVGFSDSGEIEALEMQVFSNGGWTREVSIAVMDHAMSNIDGSYFIPNALYEGFVVRTNVVSPAAFRGFGAPQTLMAMEDVVESVAKYLKLDPFDVKKLNLYDNEDVTPFGQTLERCRLEQAWDELLLDSDYKQRLELIDVFNSENKYRKRGISVVPLKFGISYSEAPFLNSGNALVNIFKDGSVSVSVGGTEMGQGLMTKVCQVVASTLECPLENVFVSDTATDRTPNAAPTAASVGSDVYCGGAKDAAEKLNERLISLKKEMNFPNEVSFNDVASAAYFARANLSAQGFYVLRELNPLHWPDHPHSDNPVGPDWKGVVTPYWVYGAACAEVEIDCLTGDSVIKRVDIIQDVGDSLSPYVDVGQVEGGFVQGAGWCTMEDIVMGDEFHQWVEPGLFETNNLDFYKIPLSNDVPEVFNIALMKNVPEEFGFQRSKATGEPPFFLGASVYFAIQDAVVRYREEELGIEDFTSLQFDSPATCERIRMACADELSRLIVDDEEEHRSFYIHNSL